MIDKEIDALMRLADQHYFVQTGHVEWSGTTEELREKPELIEAYLGI
jgi:branched-chain amino acid transport system ATP-binding protein